MKWNVRMADVADGIQWWALDNGTDPIEYFSCRMAACAIRDVRNRRGV